MKNTLLLLVNLFIINQLAYSQRRDYLVTLKTDFGTMHLILFDETPKHKANFIKLTKDKFYDGLLFHRIIKDFMIQGGDPTSRDAKPEQRLGNGGDKNTARIPFEFNPKRVHQKGALAAARDNNPEKASSYCQFYIVQGKKIGDNELNALQQQNELTYTTEQREFYKTIGGTPRLDNKYTVFGQVIDNQAVIDSIATQPRNQFDRPLKDIKMEVSIKKMRKKKITRKYGYVF